ncbi:methyltransferase domain-containing protein [Flavilitoribacter nigricans]|uniref:Methyltransferase type 11 domain-containing protein n=1 Tax=Flavilitoribacter nigricans (strain ATCC 23147 / DSM 23189 / NBRC 102662 / NCIMB 1420 / SS-2) TaxID=1122177 RepID=A0A2D0MWY5_FLAN2|nr:methyltransferase domain-containing protein [Flavilitoribacter nigricans]PHN00717.1 hypothetical protein CRP01_40755 [Flavilitoribacter nigricans DSM 23189 = NBRC 102662]
MDYVKLAQLFLKYPVRFVKNLNRENISKYKYAIQTEDPRQILENMERFLSNLPLVTHSAQDGALPARIRDFVAELEVLTAQRSKTVILFVSHETTLTGAPLIIHRVARHFQDHHEIFPVFLLLKGGKIRDLFVKEFASYPFPETLSEFEKGKELQKLLPAIMAKIPIEYAFVNSAESRFVLPLLKRSKIPKIISLVHEMGNLYPKNSWRGISRYSDQVVFPCEFVREKAMENYRFPASIVSIKGQGLLKPEIFEADVSQCRQFVRKQLGIPENARIVLSCGTPIARKGIDIFVFTAISTLSKWTDAAPLYFLWIGDAPDNYYQQWSRRDIEFSSWSENILLMDSQDDTIPWFVGSDIFLLTSRGDPFPCVVHEALAAGLQVVGFENTGGIKEMLPPQAAVLHPYGDLAAASSSIIFHLQNANPEIRTSIVNYAKQHLNYRNYSKYLFELTEKKTEPREDMYPLRDELPVPPPSLMHYRESAESHLKAGKREVDSIRTCLQNSGYNFSSFKRVLEFGCNNCRLLRWFYEEDERKELWGCDVDEQAIKWSKDNLGEVINVVHNNHYPSLDFADNYFELVFAGSIFTHIDNNAQDWLDELTRITRPGGLLYLTFLDEHSMYTLANEPNRPVYQRVAAHREAAKIWKGEFHRIGFLPDKGDKTADLILCHSDYIKNMHNENLELIQVMKKAYSGFQTAYLFRKKLQENGTDLP